MATKQKVSAKTTSAPNAEKNASKVKDVQAGQNIAKKIVTFSIFSDLQNQMIALAAYNKITNKADKNISRIIRSALDYYLKVINYSPDVIDLKEPNVAYITAVKDAWRTEDAHSKKVTVTAELTEAANATLATLAGYNKLLSIKPNTASALVRNAITLYLDAGEQDYKKFL